MHTRVLVVLVLLVLAPGLGAQHRVGELVASDRASADQFGHAVDLDGPFAVVGAWFDDDAGSASGSAYVFELQPSGVWSQVAKLVATDAAAGDLFGISVGISGTTVVVGARNDADSGSQSGSAYVFDRQSSGSWIQTTKLTANDAMERDQFGATVGIDGDRIAIGAPRADARAVDSGAAYVFGRQGASWTQVSKLAPTSLGPSYFFGLSLAMSDGWLAIGSRDDTRGTNAGAVQVYRRNGSYVSAGKLLPPSDQRFGFGNQICVSRDRLLVGCGPRVGGPRAGIVYLYELSAGSRWILQDEFLPPDGPDDNFGLSGLAVSSDRAVIGAWLGQTGGSTTGKAWVYERLAAGDWRRTAELTAPRARRGDGFGWAVAIDRARILVSAKARSTGGAVVAFDGLQSVYIASGEPLTIGGANFNVSDFSVGIGAFRRDFFRVTRNVPTPVPSQLVSPSTIAQLKLLFQRAGVTGLRFIDQPDPNATVVYMVNQFGAPGKVIGASLSEFAIPVAGFRGVDRYNTDKRGVVVVEKQITFIRTAELIAHELGHAFGLGHIDTDRCDNPIMRGSGSLGGNRFCGGISKRTDGLLPTTSNSIYHLRRHTDRTPRSVLAGETPSILPGTWDLTGGELLDVVIDALGPGLNAMTLHDVRVLANDGGETEAIASFAQLTLAQLSQQSFVVPDGAEFMVLAASQPAGTPDILLAAGDPRVPANVSIHAGRGTRALTLQRRSSAGPEFERIADALLTGNPSGACNPIYGLGCPGSGAKTPALGIRGCAAPNERVQIELRDGLGGSSAAVAIGFQRGRLPLGGGCSLLLGSLAPVVIGPVRLGGTGAGNGAFTWPLTIPSDSPAVTIYLQAFALDSGAATGLSSSNGVELRISAP